MKSSKVPAVLERNPMHLGRKPGERLPVVTFEDFTEVEPAPPPTELAWRTAPGMPYDNGLKEARPGVAITWTPVRKRVMRKLQSRGNRVAVAKFMTKWSREDAES